MQNNEKIFKSIKEKLKLEICKDKTFVVAIVMHEDDTHNYLTKIYCRKGTPISGYVYDVKNDCYYIECCDCVILGIVPVSFMQRMPGVGNWSQRVPMPESVIIKYLTLEQQNELKNFKSRYKESHFKWHYMQIIVREGDQFNVD